jgi:hypothetical protein
MTSEEDPRAARSASVSESGFKVVPWPAPSRASSAPSCRCIRRAGSAPLDVEELLKGSIESPIRGSPRVTLEEVDADEVVVRIAATPPDPRDGPRLAGEVLRAITPQVASGALRSG